MQSYLIKSPGEAASAEIYLVKKTQYLSSGLRACVCGAWSSLRYLGVGTWKPEYSQEARAVASCNDGLVVGTMTRQVHDVHQVFVVPNSCQNNEKDSLNSISLPRCTALSENVIFLSVFMVGWSMIASCGSRNKHV